MRTLSCLYRHCGATLSEAEGDTTWQELGMPLCPTHYALVKRERRERRINRQRERTWYGLATYPGFQAIMERVWEGQDRREGRS